MINREGREYRINAFLRPYDDCVRQVASQIKRTCHDLRSRILAAFNFVSTRIRYVSDKQLRGLPEYWQFPCETLENRMGDCEDTSFLLASLILALGVNKRHVRVVLGKYYGKGHAWVEVFINGKWYLLESTLERPVHGWEEIKPIDFEYKRGYIPEWYVYYHYCEHIGERGIYDRYPLRLKILPAI